MSNLNKTFWKLTHAPRKFGGDLDKLAGYFDHFQDPWEYESSAFERRKAEIITGWISKLAPKNILELGCAEGWLTKKLAATGAAVTAVDSSVTAVTRAKALCPKVKFLTGDFNRLSELAVKHFNVVVASEVLYYPKTGDTEIFLGGVKADYLVTANSWVAGKKVDQMVIKSGWWELNKTWVWAFEGEPKGAKIAIWKK